MSKLYLKSMDIQNFKTFSGTFHIEFSQGMNAVFASSDYPLKSGLWDFFDAIRWILGSRQHHGEKLLFDSVSDNNCAKVKLIIVDEDEKEIVITRRFFKDGDEEIISDVSQEDLARLQKHLLSDGEKSIEFGSTKIVAANNDKQIATQADAMIGITTDKAGVSKIVEL
ncbi:MAG: hypothetical protein II413_10405, partial [Treponema sp.]|nr:hypothetical protein [Treponema sp.]